MKASLIECVASLGGHFECAREETSSRVAATTDPAIVRISPAGIRNAARFRVRWSDREQHPLVETASRVVSEASAALIGAERDGVRVDGLFHYGAVDLDPGLLVVWILLSGKPDEQLPEWMPVIAGQPDPACPIDWWLVELREDIEQRFLEARWPRPREITVLANSAHRVDAAGRSYFAG